MAFVKGGAAGGEDCGGSGTDDGYKVDVLRHKELTFNSLFIPHHVCCW